MYQDFDWTDGGTLGAVSRLHGFFLNSQVPAQSGAVPATSWKSSTENQESNKDVSQYDPNVEIGNFLYRSPNL